MAAGTELQKGGTSMSHGRQWSRDARATGTAWQVRLDAFGAKQRRCTSRQGAGSAGLVRQNGSRIVRTAGGARLSMTKDGTRETTTRAQRKTVRFFSSWMQR